MKTLFKLTLLAFVLAIMTPIAFFAWRMCKIRGMPSTDSGACRPLIPGHAVH